MYTIPYKEAREKFEYILEQACEDGETIVVSRKNGRHAVIMSEREYNGLLETIYLTSSPKNTERLLESVNVLESNSPRSKTT
ncbi:type II toxin-antitoxin system prevent-host-death family antitoxin [Exiguobacterium profundum]|uniref:type II toxin-antitoxin system Phd/YefM family antitoxin n=1 Tax=Exiguobacterium TaxID=33986 RepID=UPI0004DEF30C|nr:MULTISPECIES: type II toxin-antitoxin system prevent-host-death family antitoxin [Exiguobacterium]MDX5980429.1 type II toxin-antitoxin system prevent-host-death family antitoxin [Exiguobacterium profundum]